jgi:hypothetical protein
MATDDRPKLPRATLRDEKLYVEGEKEPYFQDREEAIFLHVNALTISRGYARPDLTPGGKGFVESLSGIATLEDRDRFAVIGLETDPTTPIRFHLESVPDTDTKRHGRAGISFHPYDWEDPDRPECFWISGYCTSQYFDDLLAAVRRGYVDHIRVGMTTTMWTRNKSFTFRTSRTWHLAPPIDREATRPSSELGNISSLIWEEKFGSGPVNEAKVEATPPKPQIVELPPRLYSMLTALLVIGLMLLVLTFLRH